ncbi:MAG: hypothetical protein H6598_02110 [Flavobacteriales bacterium]|nr:hypothetical protein [Flavobacteriales bacterium]
MAKATSILNLNGKLHDVVIYQSDGKTIVRAKREYFSDMVKNDPAFEEARERIDYLQLANSFSTATYRMAKEFAYKMNFKSQNDMNGLIFHQIKLEDPTAFDYQKIRKALSGTILNYKDTQPLVDTVLLDGDVIINCDKEILGPVSLKFLIGTLPKVKKVKGKYKAAIDMAEVDVVELTLQPEDYHTTMRLNLGIEANQIVVAIVHPTYEVDHVEWVRVV